MIEASPTFVERDAPVESDHVRSGLFHRGKKRGAVGAEVNDRHSGLLQLLHHAGDVGQNVAAIVFHAEASDPAIENLDDVGPGADLISGIGGGHDDQFAHQRVPVVGRVVHHFFGVDVVARASAFDHVAGEGEGSATEADHRQLVAEMLCDQGNSFGDISEFGGAVGAQVRDVFLAADGLLDDWTFSGGEMEGQAHDFERQQEVGEDDGGVDAEEFGGGNGDLGGKRGLLADFEKRMLLADRAIFGHIASGLAHEPDGRAVDGLRFAGAHEAGIWSRHELMNVAFFEGACSDRKTAKGDHH